MKTIAQISTPLGSGGISIVRVSGDKALELSLNFFYANNLTAQTIKPRYMYLGNFVHKDIFDKCLMVYFKAPFSFTGEDVVEFHLHGGELLTTLVLESLIQAGASLALNGEFSRRAFMNGKMSLDEAEGMIATINATSAAELKAEKRFMEGKVFKEIVEYQNVIKDCLADICVLVDYPEHDDEVNTFAEIGAKIENVYNKILKLLNTGDVGKGIKFGVSVAIVGKPNVGKSSILNSLIGKERAIVTNIKGTTRDIIAETITHKGIKLNFLDTAGVRESDDEVEKIGITKTVNAIEQADIVLCVLDASNNLDEEDNAILKLVKDKNTLYILNKIDIGKTLKMDNSIEISTKTNENIDKIAENILKIMKLDKINYSETIITNQRHQIAVKNTVQNLQQFLELLNTQTADIVAMYLNRAWQNLGEITGETTTEEILNKVFSKFCLGK